MGKQRKKKTEHEENKSIILQRENLERKETKTRRESKGGQKGRTRRCLTSALITPNFVFVVKHTRPGKFILSHSAI